MSHFPVILSAPSGGGKTTVTHRLMQRRNDLGYSVSCTTRAPRAGEVNDVDYHFLSEAQFIAKRDAGELAESAVVHGKMYGTLKSAMQTVLDSGKHVLMDIDVQGAAQVIKAYPATVLVFLLPPSVEVLVERLMGRNTENPQALLARLKSAHAELQEVERYHYVVVNDDLERTVSRVSSVIDAEEVKRSRVHKLDTQVAGLVSRLQHEISGLSKQL